MFAVFTGTGLAAIMGATAGVLFSTVLAAGRSEGVGVTGIPPGPPKTWVGRWECELSAGRTAFPTGDATSVGSSVLPVGADLLAVAPEPDAVVPGGVEVGVGVILFSSWSRGGTSLRFLLTSSTGLTSTVVGALGAAIGVLCFASATTGAWGGAPRWSFSAGVPKTPASPREDSDRTGGGGAGRTAAGTSS